MSDLRRERFEKWAITEFINITKYGATGVYCYPDAHLAWTAWCSAIESVVVEFTEEVYFCPSKTELEQASDKGFSHAMEMVKGALDKAGIKYE